MQNLFISTFATQKLEVSMIIRRALSSFVPRSSPVSEESVRRVQWFVDNTSRLAILTGAGLSTESGMPDYRSADVGLYSRGGYRPMTYQQFIATDAARRRYWARSFVTWKNVIKLKPNLAHKALASWEDKLSTSIITQNVDGLQQAAGSQRVVELHGSIHTVKCTTCDWRLPRADYQLALEVQNKDLIADSKWADVLDPETIHRSQRPDGDVDLEGEFVELFQTVPCRACDSFLIPDVVFFGDNVRRALVEHCYDIVDSADSLLVLGSSLQVFSGYRFVLHALQNRKNILVVNIGETRASKLDVEHVEARLGELLPRILVR